MNPETNEHLISEEDWWNDFISKLIFWTDKQEFCINENDVFVNDNEKFYELFKDNPNISVLKLPKNYHPQIQYFIEAVGISHLSKSVKIGLVSEVTPVIERGLTKQIQNYVPYILRYLYKLEHDHYERLKKDVISAQLKNLTCYSLESLKVKYSLNNESVPSEQDSLLYNGNLYIQREKLEDTDHLAIELSKLFGDMRGLDDFLISLFDKKTEDKIERLMKAKGIEELPNDEKEWSHVVEMKGEFVEGKERGETIVEKKLPPLNISEAPQTSMPSQIPEGSESIIEQKRIEKKEWQPELTPAEVETQVNKLQVLERTEPKSTIPEILEAGEPRSEPQPPPKPPRETAKDTLTQEAKTAIGKWGEEFALKCLKDKLSKKYHQGEVKETEDGFAIICEDKTFVELHWLNKNRDEGEGYDIKVIENDNEEYIEVKSTTTDDKGWFDMSNKQWEFVLEKEDNFHIYRIYNAGTKEAKLVDIPNPKQLWQEGRLTAYPIRIRI